MNENEAKYGRGDLETCSGLSLMDVGVGNDVLGLCLHYEKGKTFMAFVPTSGAELSDVVGKPDTEAIEKNRKHEM